MKRTTKRTPVKKDEKTPAIKTEAAESTPIAVEAKAASVASVKSVKSTGNAKQKTTPKTEPKGEQNVNASEVTLQDSNDVKYVPSAKPTEKKGVQKPKLSAAAEAADSGTTKTPLPNPVEAVKMEEKDGETVPLEGERVEEKVKEKLKTTCEPEETPNDLNGMKEAALKSQEGEGAHHQANDYNVDEEMEDYGEQEGFEDPGDEDGGEDDESDLDGEGGGMEEEQIQMSALARDRKLKKELEIFVGGLDRDAVEDDVKKTFESIGEIVEVRLLRNPLTNKNKGFAFVKFGTKEQAARALSEMKSPTIRGKRCGVAPSEDNDTLFVGNICNTWTKEAIKRKLKEYGVDGIENITLVGDAKNEGLSRGFAFLEFPCHEDAMVAYKRLQKPDVVLGHAERTVKVAFAEPIREPDPEIMAQVKSVFVDGLPPYWDEERVKEQLKGYGEIERVILARNMATAKRKDFGFVNFTTHEAAVGCIEGVNNKELGDDGKTKMKARARLANPLPKTQAVKGGMRGGFRIGRSGIGYIGSGRGFMRGRHSYDGAVFQRGRGLHPRGRGRAGRFLYSNSNDMGRQFSEFRGRRPVGGRGGRRGSFLGVYEGSGEEFVPGGATSSRFDSDRPRHGALDRGRRGYPFSPEEDFERSFGVRRYGDDSYLYTDGGHGIKRSYSMMDHESSYLETGSRIRHRYDDPDSLSYGTHYRGTGSSVYPRDYYSSDYGASSYSSLYGSGRSMGGGYYY